MLKDSENYISSVATLGNSEIKESGQKLVVTGSSDKLIRIYNDDDEPSHILVGHTDNGWSIFHPTN